LRKKRDFGGKKDEAGVGLYASKKKAWAQRRIQAGSLQLLAKA
jgi:hypothetical protein